MASTPADDFPVTVPAAPNGAGVLRAAAALCVLNDVFCEAESLGVRSEAWSESMGARDRHRR